MRTLRAALVLAAVSAAAAAPPASSGELDRDHAGRRSGPPLAASAAPLPPALGCAATYRRVDVGLNWFDTSDGYPYPIGDDEVWYFNLPFPFDYYGERVSTVQVCANGWASFFEPTGNMGDNDPDAFPNTTAPRGAMGLFWADLDPTAPVQRNLLLKTVGTAPNRAFVVTWDGFPRYLQPSTSYTFQLVLYETTNVIRYQYQLMQGDQTDMSIGIENDAGDDGIEYSYQQNRNMNNKAMEWRPTSPGIASCNNAPALACGARLTAVSPGNRNDYTEYGCSDRWYDGSERLYALTLTGVTLVDIKVAPSVPDPTRTLRAILFEACDLCRCIEEPGPRIRTMLGPGRYYVMVDGEVAADDVDFDLSVDCETEMGTPTGSRLNVGSGTTCGGLMLDFDRFADGRGVWTSDGWLRFEADRNYWALRVDGGRIYTTNPDRTECTGFDHMVSWVDDASGKAIAYFKTGEVEVVQTVYATVTTASPPCCGARVDTRVRNLDTVPHFYELRALYSTDFGPGTASCAGTSRVQSGPLHVGTTDHTVERSLNCDAGGICATSCATPVELKSADNGQTRLVVQVIGNSSPDAVKGEWVHYFDAEALCSAPPDPWLGGISPPENMTACNSQNGLLYAWRVPPSPQVTCVGPGDCLAPEQEASFTHMFGKGCRLNPGCSTCLATTDLTVSESTACAGSSVLLDASRSTVTGCTGTVTYAWTRDGQPLGVTVDRYTATEPAPGTHTYTVTLSCEPPPMGITCADTRSAMVSFVDCAACAANAQVTGPSGTFCPLTPVVLDGTGSVLTSCPGTESWSWSRNGVPVPGETFSTIQVVETAVGSYDYTLTLSCDPPPAGLNCRSTSAPFTVTYALSGPTPLDRGNTLYATKTATDVTLEWTRPPDGTVEDQLLRGTAKRDLLPPGPPVAQPGLVTPFAIDLGAAIDAGSYYYRVRGVSCGTPGPY